MGKTPEDINTEQRDLESCAAQAHMAQFERYLRFELNRSIVTVDAYLDDLTHFAGFITAGKAAEAQFESVTRSDIRSWMLHMSKSGNSPRSIRRRLQSLRTFFRFLLKTGVVKANPAMGIPLPQLAKNLPEIIRENEMEEILAPEPGTLLDFGAMRDHMVMLLFYATGMRHAEMASLTNNDINFARDEIRIIGKRNKERAVPLAPDVVEEIRQYMALRDREFPDASAPAAAFFLNDKGMPLPYHAFARITKKALSATNANKRSPHVLRHTFATAMLRNGAEINSVKEMLGHSSLASTQIYTHLSFEELKENYRRSHPHSTIDPKE